ncbi:MAG: hypothetical protein LBU65_12425 [Planctomycetaceae bacterium]|jgi:zinc protease|nr:hypothetical protein [Planctomycetaceae bacterium]
MKNIILTLTVVLISVTSLNAAPKANSEYVIVVSRAAQNDVRWKPVITALQKKNGKLKPSVVTYDSNVAETKNALQSCMPKYVCFVAKPEDAGHDFIVSVHHLTRGLDDDPYPDVIWGVITGYTPNAALELAKFNKPFVVKRAASGTSSFNLDRFDEGILWNEGKKGEIMIKKKGKPAYSESGTDDPTESIIKMFNEFAPDLWFTSGHATEDNWMIGYNYKAGFLEHKNGVIVGHAANGKYFTANSPNPKVYIAAGNCLMGHVNRVDCMATSFMNSCGVKQMIGYTVESWFGYGGWGVGSYFFGQSDRFTLAEANFANQAALNWRLSKIQSSSEKNKRDEKGLLYDRDVIAFYGDPALEIRTTSSPKSTYSQKLATNNEDGKTILTLTLTDSRGKESWNSDRPAVQLLPKRIQNFQVLEGENFNPVVTDNFILVPMPTNKEETKTIKIVIRAEQ